MLQLTKHQLLHGNWYMQQMLHSEFMELVKHSSWIKERRKIDVCVSYLWGHQHCPVIILRVLPAKSITVTSFDVLPPIWMMWDFKLFMILFIECGRSYKKSIFSLSMEQTRVDCGVTLNKLNQSWIFVPWLQITVLTFRSIYNSFVMQSWTNIDNLHANVAFCAKKEWVVSNLMWCLSP